MDPHPFQSLETNLVTYRMWMDEPIKIDYPTFTQQPPCGASQVLDVYFDGTAAFESL